MDSPEVENSTPQQEVQELVAYLQNEGGYSRADIAAHIGVSYVGLGYVLAGTRSGKQMLAPLRKMADALESRIVAENEKQAQRAEESRPFEEGQDALDRASQQRINEIEAVTRAFQRQREEQDAYKQMVAAAYRANGVPRSSIPTLLRPWIDRRMVEQAVQREALQARRPPLQIAAPQSRPFHQAAASRKDALPPPAAQPGAPMLPAPRPTTIREVTSDEDAALRQAAFYAIIDKSRWH